jgi:hypothetical protein
MHRALEEKIWPGKESELNAGRTIIAFFDAFFSSSVFSFTRRDAKLSCHIVTIMLNVDWAANNEFIHSLVYEERTAFLVTIHRETRQALWFKPSSLMK